MTLRWCLLSPQRILGEGGCRITTSDTWVRFRAESNGFMGGCKVLANNTGLSFMTPTWPPGRGLPTVLVGSTFAGSKIGQKIGQKTGLFNFRVQF